MVGIGTSQYVYDLVSSMIKDALSVEAISIDPVSCAKVCRLTLTPGCRHHLVPVVLCSFTVSKITACSKPIAIIRFNGLDGWLAFRCSVWLGSMIEQHQQIALDT